MRGYKFVGMIVAVLAMAGAPAMAQVDCANIPTSIGPVTQEYIDACFNPAAATGGIEGPTDNAWGAESTRASLDFMVLNTPEVLTSVGTIAATGFVGGCDFANNDFSQLYCGDTTGSFFSLSTADATQTNIGTFTAPGAETITGLAWDATTSTMYMCTTDVATSSLLTVDLATGAATLVGAISGSAATIACAVDTAGNMWGYDIVDDNFYAIDKATGAGTVVGPIGFDGNFGQGMDFDHDTGTCYMFAFNATTFLPELRTCDTATGATTFIGTMGASVPGGLVQWGGGAIETNDVPVELMSIGVE